MGRFKIDEPLPLEQVEALEKLEHTSDDELLQEAIQDGEDLQTLTLEQRARVRQRLADTARRLVGEGAHARDSSAIRPETLADAPPARSSHVPDARAPGKTDGRS
jgi:hypothetical protein